MSLTTGRGPLSGKPAGKFSKPVPDGLAYVEPFPRRVRALQGGTTVVDSERVLLVHRQGAPPTYAFPAGDVSGVPSDDEPLADGYVQVPWDAVDAWVEEDGQVFMHPRNPYHRVDCVPTHRRLRVEIDGTVLVDTTDTVGVYETSLEPRLYVRPRYVRCTLVTSPTTTYCPYKGTASYWTAVIGERRVPDIAWSYEDPHPECAPIGGFLSFDQARATVETDLPSPPGAGQGRAGPEDPRRTTPGGDE